MRITVDFGDLRATMREIEGGIADAATAAMRETTAEAKAALRAQVTSNGLGQRLANTWRGEVFPKSRRSVTPAGFIHSAAPDIVDAFERGARIVPRAGHKYLAIPTRNVPRARGHGRASSTKRMTPHEVEQAFNQDLVIRPGREGRLLAFIAKDRGTTKRGALRKVRKGRLAWGDRQELVLMFTLVPTVQLPKLLDLNAVAERWSVAFVEAFTRGA